MKNLNYEQLIFLATTTSLKIAKESDDDEILVLADFFSLLGSALTLIYDRKDINSSTKSKDT